MLPQENPYALEGDTTSYAWSLGLLIPWVMLRFVEAVIMLFGAFSEPRTWGTIRRARIVLCLQGLVSSLSVVIHGFYFPKFIIMDVTILASVAIWLSYLSRSKRVARVFGAE